MAKLTYTDEDIRREAARQHSEILRNPDRLEVGDEMRNTLIPSAAGDGPESGLTWGHLSYDDFHDASNQVQELLDDAPDLSRWVIDLGCSYLKDATNLVWGRGTSWDLAVQVAHRPGIKADLHDELVAAIRAAVNLVLASRGIDSPELQQHGTPQEATR